MENYSFTGTEIAIIGMSGRFPKSRGINEYWDNIKNGKECITFFEEEELINSGIDEREVKDPDYIKAYGYLENSDRFDNNFFKYNEREALLMDPQMRLLHEVVWEALEDSGYNPETSQKKIGLYVGASDNLYWQVVSTIGNYSTISDHFATFQLNNKDFLATQIAYKLNLKGPAVTISTACSTSLVTVHTACQALLGGECEIALAGGVTISLPSKKGYMYQEGMILSPNGHCCPFDEESAGIVGGNGAGIVALKLLEDAIEDGDYIYGVIKGSAINNDGNRKVGYSAPSIEGQVEVIRTAYKMAEVDPETISYVETHGTATRIGDSIEIEALKQAFNTKKKNFCALGAVKGNIGHLDIAAGIAGLIKAVLILKHKIIPPTINFKKPNSHINFENSPFYINTEMKAWKDKSIPLRIGVSSFGIGGTNAHILLEEAPKINQHKTSEADNKFNIIPISAHKSECLEEIMANLRNYLMNNREVDIRDISNTLQKYRKNLRYRKTFVCSDCSELIEELESDINRKGESSRVNREFKNNQVIFMFPGQGAQYANMGADLLSLNNSFSVEFNRCFKILKRLTGKDFKQIVYSGLTQEWTKDTSIVQPFLFSFEYSLANLLIACGVYPQAMIGHSLGEYVAACIAGVFSLEDCLRIICKRAELMQKMPIGSMLSIMGSEEELKADLDNRYSIAALNNADRTVISGNVEDIEEINEKLKEKGYVCTKLHTTRAFHSKMTEVVIDEFRKVFESVNFNTPNIPFISNFTGTWILQEEAMDPEYWCKHLRHTVKFYQGVGTLLEKDKGIFIEVGPGNTLNSFVNNHEKKTDNHYSMNLMRHIKEEILDEEHILKRLGKLWTLGVDIKWDNYFNYEGKKVPLPVYPFDGKEFVIKGNPFELIKKNNNDELIKQKKDINDWFYVPNWKGKSINSYYYEDIKNLSGTYVLFLEDEQFGNQLYEYLRHNDFDVITVKMGSSFQVLDSNNYVINPIEKSDYDMLFKMINDKDIKQIIHTWTVTTGLCEFDNIQQRGLYSLINITKSISEYSNMDNIGLTVVSNGLSDVLGNENIMPYKSTLIGAMRVIPQENPSILSKLIDIEWPITNSMIFNQICDEISVGFGDKIVALRESRRWVQYYENVKIEESFREIDINKDSVFIIIGGLGRLGKIFTELFISKYKAKVVVITRSFFPCKYQWKEWVDNNSSEDEISKTIGLFNDLENLGGNIDVYQADITDEVELSNIVEEVEKRFGKITGVIHAAARTDTNSIKVSINDVTMEECEEQLKAKALGVISLEKALRGKDIKYCFLFSSLASILGGLGYIAYSSANSFLDFYAKKVARESSTRWISVNWDNWNVDEVERDSLAILPDEGKIVFEILKLWRESQVIISTYDLRARLEKWVTLESIKSANINNKDIIENISGELNSIEDIIKSIWEEQLGVKDINDNDNFFELGGDSLKALSIIAMIQRKLNKKLKLSEFFKKPTISEIAELLKDNIETIQIQKVIDKKYYKLCSSQERLFILNQMHKESIAYNLPQIIIMNGKINGEKIRECFIKFVNRHEALRTSFHYIKGEIVQVIHDKAELQFKYIEVKEEEINKCIKEFVRPFILENPSPFRVELLKIDKYKHILMVDCHHIIADGESFKILFDEFTRLYKGEELPPLQLRYRDYCEWENSEGYKKIIAEQKSFWMKQLLGKLPQLELPLDFIRKDKLDYDGDSIVFNFDTDLTKKINEYVVNQNATKFGFFLTVLNILLSKLSNQKDIIIGTPVARRGNLETQNVFGHFLNVLPMRSFPMGEKNFNNFFKEVTDNTVRSFENQDFSYKDMVEMLNINWKANRNPIFDVMLVMQNVKKSIMEIEGLKVTPYNLESKCAKFDLTFEIFEDEEKFTVLLEYCTELFTKRTIEQFTKYLKNIIEYVLEYNECLISDVKLANHISNMNKLSSSFEF